MCEGPINSREATRLLSDVLDDLLASVPFRRRLGRGAADRLTDELTQVLAAASEQILSTHLTFPERRAVFHAVLERFRRSPAAEQRTICAHLDRLDRLVPLIGRFGRRFLKLSPEARRRCLQACERSRWALLADGHAQVHHLVQMAFMECAEVWPGAPAGPDGPARGLRPAGRAA